MFFLCSFLYLVEKYELDWRTLRHTFSWIGLLQNYFSFTFPRRTDRKQCWEDLELLVCDVILVALFCIWFFGILLLIYLDLQGAVSARAPLNCLELESLGHACFDDGSEGSLADVSKLMFPWETIIFGEHWSSRYFVLEKVRKGMKLDGDAWLKYYCLYWCHFCFFWPQLGVKERLMHPLAWRACYN